MSTSRRVSAGNQRKVSRLFAPEPVRELPGQARVLGCCIQQVTRHGVLPSCQLMDKGKGWDRFAAAQGGRTDPRFRRSRDTWLTCLPISFGLLVGEASADGTAESGRNPDTGGLVTLHRVGGGDTLARSFGVSWNLGFQRQERPRAEHLAGRRKQEGSQEAVPTPTGERPHEFGAGPMRRKSQGVGRTGAPQARPGRARPPPLPLSESGSGKTKTQWECGFSGGRFPQAVRSIPPSCAFDSPKLCVHSGPAPSGAIRHPRRPSGVSAARSSIRMPDRSSHAASFTARECFRRSPSDANAIRSRSAAVTIG